MPTAAVTSSAMRACCAAHAAAAPSGRGLRAQAPVSSRRNVQAAMFGRSAPKAEAPTTVVSAAISNVDTSGEGTAIEVGGKLIVVESDGTVIISGNDAASGPAPSETAEVEYLTGRAAAVQKHFEGALGADDFMTRVEMALYAFGFTGDNSIAMVNLCRDEVTLTLKQRIESVFGSSFSTNGLGGVLTCGATGMGAGFSHSPVCAGGKERYVFFSFPHISINSVGDVGPMSRPGRPGQSCACGALIKATGEIKAEGVMCNCKIPGVHDALDPEMSILKQRLARRLRHDGATDESVKSIDLVQMTKVADRTISDDLEYLISKTVDTNKADYAVVTGIQIHNWGADFRDESPNMEFVQVTSAYVVVDGQKTHLDIASLPPMTPRLLRLVAGPASVCNQGGETMLREEDAPYLFDSKDARKAQTDRLRRYMSLLKEEGLTGTTSYTPAWQGKIARAAPNRGEHDNSTVIDSSFAEDKELREVWELLEQRYKMSSKQ